MSQFYDQASLVMVPSGYKAGKVYSQKPLSTDGELTFTRNSNATRVNADGLIEKCRTNYAAYSETFENANWTKANSTVTPNTIANPLDGQLTADTLNITANTYSGLYLYTGISSGNSTNSLYVKAGTLNYFWILIDGSSGKSVFFNLSSGTIHSQAAGMVGRITPLSNGWYRCSITNESLSSNNYHQFGFSDNTGFTPSVSGTGYIFGAQAELSDFGPTDYIPTTSAAVSVGPTANVPRLDYSGGGCSRLILEPQRTNYHLYSENSAQWTQPADGLTIAYNTSETLDPSGYYGAEKVISVSGNKRMFQLLSNPSGPLTISAFVKAGTADIFDFLTTSGSIFVEFNLTTLAINASSGTGTITSYGNGWYRLTASTSSAISNEVIQYRFLNDAGKYMYFWGAQAEAGAYATSYIPTLGASVTRLADAAYKTGIASLIGQTEGTIFYNGYFGREATEVYLFLQNAASAGVVDSIYLQKASTEISLSVFTTTQQVFISGGAFTIGQRIKVAAAYKANDFVLYVNGTQIGTDNSGSVPTCGVLQLASYRGAPTAAEFIAEEGVNQALLFKTRLTNAQLAELTTL